MQRMSLAFFALLLVATGCASGPTASGPTATAAPNTTATPDTTATPTSAQSLTTTAAPTTDTTTTTTTTIRPDEPAPDGLEHLIAGHNDIDADRINLVFVPWGWDDLDDFRVTTEFFLGWDGTANVFDFDGRPTDDPQDVAGADLGLFGFEPFRSNHDRFNLWISDIGPSGPSQFLNNTEIPPFELPDLSVVTMALDPERVFPGISSAAGQDVSFAFDPEQPRTGDDSVANAMVRVQSSFPAETMRDLPHELGHALFGFADEYVGRLGPSSLTPRDSFWPSCPADRETAEAWWDDLIGQYDPMVDIYIDEMITAGFGEELDREFLREQNTTRYVEEGCFGVPGSYRSAEDTLMVFNAPAFGLTNRRSAERILALWEG